MLSSDDLSLVIVYAGLQMLMGDVLHIYLTCLRNFYRMVKMIRVSRDLPCRCKSCTCKCCQITRLLSVPDILTCRVKKIPSSYEITFLVTTLQGQDNTNFSSLFNIL